MTVVMSTVMAQVKSLPVGFRVASGRSASDRGVIDHAMLMGAVSSRLRALVHTPPTASEALQEALDDCAQALELLRPALVQERFCGQRIERELEELRRALAAARLELAGTRDGERRALHMAEHDGLTALANRNCFQTRLNEALASSAANVNADAQAPTLAVLFLDLDDFEPINDKHGHETGDALLRIVAQRLSRSVRGGDFVGRLGGDEFACLLFAPMGREQLSHVASKLFDAISAPFSMVPLHLTVRPNIGIAMSPQDGDTAATLLQRADTAMKRAKRRQLGYTFFDRQVDA